MEEYCASEEEIFSVKNWSGIDGILCVWQGGIGEYHLNSEKLGFNMAVLNPIVKV